MAAYFISDLHLGASYDADTRHRERLVCDFLRSIEEDCAELYLVGDILDYWFEYRTVVPRGYVRFFGQLSRMADCGTKITWFVGNHDIWLFDYLRDEIPLRVVDGALETEIYGARFYIAHGDGIGRLKRSFRLIRSIFRNKFCQKLYSGIHPRWTIPFAHGWSSHSRKTGGYNDVAGGADDPYVEFSRCLEAAGSHFDYYVFGHRHVMLQERIPEKAEVVVLGDWLTHFSYARWDGDKMQLLICRHAKEASA